MASASGRLMLLKFKNDAGSPALVSIVGTQTKTMSRNNEIVDVTHSESTGAWRELLSGGGIKSMSFSGGGTVTDKASVVVFQDAADDGTLRDGEVIVPGVGTFAGKFAVSAYELSGEHNADVKFSVSLESSGVITFTVEP